MTEISFTEAIRMEDGKLHNLNYHQKRIDATLRRFWHNEHNDISLQSALSHIMPQDGIYKIHIEYNGEGISEITAREIQKLKTELYTIISDHSSKPFEQVEKDSDRDHWMTSAEAKEYGMIDNILFREKK